MATTERQNRLLVAEDWRKIYQAFQQKLSLNPKYKKSPHLKLLDACPYNFTMKILVVVGMVKIT